MIEVLSLVTLIPLRNLFVPILLTYNSLWDIFGSFQSEFLSNSVPGGSEKSGSGNSEKEISQGF